MKRQQIMIAAVGVFLLLILYFFGKTVPPQKKEMAMGAAAQASSQKPVDIQDILQEAQSRLRPAQQDYLNRLEQSVVRGDVKTQQLNAYRQLAAFWKDSADALPLYAYYTGESAKLENSEKSLTFAAQLFLDGCRAQDDPALKSWMATNAKGLFKKALELNPDNDSSKVGLGASYIFGSAAGDPQETMQGIQQILQVARKDSTNMYAQFMLGVGGMESGQYDHAAERFATVVRHQPANIEARLLLAGVDEQKGDKSAAIREYEEVKKRVGNPTMIKEIDDRIRSLQ